MFFRRIHFKSFNNIASHEPAGICGAIQIYDAANECSAFCISQKWAYLLTTVGMLGGLAHTASGQTYSLLYNFASQINDGANPYGSLLQSGSSLYGMTEAGGNSGNGTIFKYDLSTNTESVLYPFAGGANDGSGPYDSLIQAGSNLYGVTYYGGANGLQALSSGTLVQYNLSNNMESMLHAFNGDISDGYHPSGSLIQSGSILYAPALSGGTHDSGAIIAYNFSTNLENILYSFAGGPTDGREPGPLLQSGSILYGTTQYGGSTGNNPGDGTLFEYNLATNKESVLYSFLNPGPTGGPLVLSGSNLYGVAGRGGLYGAGSIFRFNLATNKETELYDFSGFPSDGAFPSSLLLSGNFLYGTTDGGGNDGAGTVFEYNLTTNKESLLHSFGGYPNDGAEPAGSLIEIGSTLYGLTVGGGDGRFNESAGTIFSITVPEPNSAAILLAMSGLFLRRRLEKLR